MSGMLTCPVCRSTVSDAASMCLSCHLPIKDVRANQRLARRRLGRRMVEAGVLGILVVAGVIGFRAREDASPSDEPARHGATQGDREVGYSGLEVVRSDDVFDGTVELTNHTDVHADVMVEVHVYDGDQEIGSLLGDVSLKPNSSAVADLTSFDQFAAFTDTVVELIAIPAAVS
jgi:hypothetical protein